MGFSFTQLNLITGVLPVLMRRSACFAQGNSAASTLRCRNRLCFFRRRAVEMPGPYYAITTQKRKRYFSVNPLGNRLLITHSVECLHGRIIALHLYPDTPGTASS